MKLKPRLVPALLAAATPAFSQALPVPVEAPETGDVRCFSLTARLARTGAGEERQRAQRAERYFLGKLLVEMRAGPLQQAILMASEPDSPAETRSCMEQTSQGFIDLAARADQP